MKLTASDKQYIAEISGEVFDEVVGAIRTVYMRRKVPYRLYVPILKTVMKDLAHNIIKAW